MFSIRISPNRFSLFLKFPRVLVLPFFSRRVVSAWSRLTTIYSVLYRVHCSLLCKPTQRPKAPLFRTNIIFLYNRRVRTIAVLQRHHCQTVATSPHHQWTPPDASSTCYWTRKHAHRRVRVIFWLLPILVHVILIGSTLPFASWSPIVPRYLLFLPIRALFTKKNENLFGFLWIENTHRISGKTHEQNPAEIRRVYIRESTRGFWGRWW